MKNQRFGIEIEMTGLTRKRASEIVAKHFDSASVYEGGTYYTYSVKDDEGRKWKFVHDSSITPQIGSRRINSAEYKVEMVSPICHYSDIENIQSIVRKLKSEGHAKVNRSCGIHIHVDASNHDARSLRNICNIMYSKEDLIYKALQVHVSREHRFCQKVDEAFLNKINQKKPKTLSQVEDIWYNGNISRKYSHYDVSRYHALNLHSVFQKGTIEFRLFNGTLHAGKIKSYIQFCLAVSHQALTQTKASRIKTHSSNEKYTFRTWLLRLGMIGDEFKTARYHLLKNLDGCIAWKDPAQAEAQKQRLKAAKEVQPANNVQEQANEQESEDMAMTQSML